MSNRTVIASLKGLSIFLVGMMGTGKTTVGKILAQQLGYRFFDTDDLIVEANALIEQATGQTERKGKPTINDIFAKKGEEYFRELESKVLVELSACTKSVIATGGGIILKTENWCYLRDGLVIWLDAPVEVLVERLENDDTRPLLQESNLKGKIEFLLEQRRSFYAEADLQIAIEGQQTPEEIVTDIFNKIPTVLRKVEPLR